jgi:hypothetical protein
MPGVDYAPDPEIPTVKPPYRNEGRVGNVRTTAQLAELSEEELRAERLEAVAQPPGSPKPQVVDFDPTTEPEPGTKPPPLAQILKEKEEQDERSSERPGRHPSVVPDRSRKPEK